MSNTINPIAPATATREEMRGWISATARALATKIHGAPTLSSLREVMQSVGFSNLSEAIAQGSMENLRACCSNLMDKAAEHRMVEDAAMRDAPASDVSVAGAADLPPPPAAIDVPADTHDVDADLATKLAQQAAELARKAADAAARAKAAPRPAAGMTPADKERLDAVEVAVRDVAHTVKVQGGDVSDMHKVLGNHDDEILRITARVGSVEDKLAPLAAVLDAIAGAGTTPTLPPAAVVAVKAAVSGDRLLSEVLPFFTPGLPQGNQIPCVASPPSFGKTFMSDEISRLYEGSFFHPFKDSLDEIDSLVGTLMPRSDGSFAVIDGPLVSAARLASTGVNTLFVGDEIFNASKKTLEWMQSFLSPRLVPHVGADGVETLRRCFVIQTKHSLEDGTFEVIKAPEDCLHFLFLGNLRTNPPEALMSRCRLMRFDYDPKWAAETACQRIDQYGCGILTAEKGTSGEKWAECWAAAMTKSREAYSRMEVSRPLCFRFLIGAVTHVARQPDADLVKLTEYVAKWAPHQIAVQNAATQDTDPTSLGVVKKIISDSFAPFVKK